MMAGSDICKGFGQIAYRDCVLGLEPRHHCPPGRVGQCRESAIELS